MDKVPKYLIENKNLSCIGIWGRVGAMVVTTEEPDKKITNTHKTEIG